MITPQAHAPTLSSPVSFGARIQPVYNKLPTSLMVLVLVVLIHTGALALMLYSSPQPPENIQQPTLHGILIPAPPAETVQAPSAQPTPPADLPPEPSKPTPKKIAPKPEPKPIPIAKAPASEKAITQEEVTTEAAAPASQPLATPITEDKSTLGAPVTPPQEDAYQFNNPRPAYPSLSRRLREQGTVVLEVLILADGSVADVRVKTSSGYRRLDDTAVKAVKRWRYMPARRGTETIEYWYIQPIEFALN